MTCSFHRGQLVTPRFFGSIIVDTGSTIPLSQLRHGDIYVVLGVVASRRGGGETWLTVVDPRGLVGDAFEGDLQAVEAS